MANYMVDFDDDESLLEAQRTSLLDTIEDRNRALSKTSLLHRMVVISKMFHDNFQEIGQFYDKLFKDIQAKYQCEGASGLLLLYPKHCVHVIEAGPEVLLELARVLRTEEQTGTGHMEKSKILIVSHDIPQRIYQQWAFRVLDIQAPRLEEYESSEDAEKLVLDMLIQLLKLGAYLARQPKVALKNVMDALHGKVPELLPQQAVIGYLLEGQEEESECISSPDFYLSQYEKPYDVTLNSELVWPMPVRLFPYN